MKRTILLALILACGTAQASEWVSLNKALSGAETAVDVSSIRITGGIRHAWVKVVYPPQAQRGVGENSLRWVSYTVSGDVFNCGDGTHRDEALTTYFTDGTTASVGPASFPTPWELVAPDSVGGAVMSFVCAWKPK
jgi:hypothetical protein